MSILDKFEYDNLGLIAGGDRMSLPNIPDIVPEIHLSKKKALNILLASIALEEIGYSHIINAEGEKLQAAIHKFASCNCFGIHDLLIVNKSVNQTLRNLIKSQLLLQFKLEDLIDLYFTDSYEDDDKC